MVAEEPVCAPTWNAAALDEPPPTSTFTTVANRCADHSAAPEPRPAICASTFGPATVHTNSPAMPDRPSRTDCASWLRADSPVMITAPLPICPGATPARAYSRSISARSPATSMCVGSSIGVSAGSLWWSVAVASMSSRGTRPGRCRLRMSRRESTSCVVVVPTSMPTLSTSRPVICSSPLAAAVRTSGRR